MKLPTTFLDRSTPFAVRAEDGCQSRKDEARNGEQGYILLAVLIMVVMVLIVLSIAAPKVAADIQRDREVELMHRGMQYRRAIQLYYRKFNAYPPNMEALEKVNQIRFLRKRYLDPVTGKDEWHLIHFGENKTPTAMGFFGQAIGGVGGAGGSTLAGTGPGGVGQSIGGPGGNAGGSIFGSNGGGSGFGGSTGGFGGGGGLGGSSGFGGTNGSSGFGSGSFGGTANGVGAGGTNGTNGTDPNATGGTSGSNSSGSSSTSNSSTFGGSGQTFGGGGIIGVESTSPKATILEYKKKKHFNEWEFVYDPMSERTQISGNTGSIGQPAGTVGNGGASSNTPSQFGSPFGSSGNSGASGNSGTSGSTPLPQ